MEVSKGSASFPSVHEHKTQAEERGSYDIGGGDNVASCGAEAAHARARLSGEQTWVGPRGRPTRKLTRARGVGEKAAAARARALFDRLLSCKTYRAKGK